MKPTLSEQSPLDYDVLRQEGIRQLEGMAGPLWTDFNLHDPGITILEQLCYVLTDLAYRCNYKLPDLLTRTGEEPYDSLYSPARILSSRPVTLTDLRKLIVDVAGVNNAWIEPVAEPQLRLYYHEAEQELSLLPDIDTAETLKLKGLYRVQLDSDCTDSTDIIDRVTRRLHAHRPLGEDYERIRVLDTQPIRIQARIEIGPSENPDTILRAIYRKITAYLCPAIPFYTLSQGLAAGRPIEEIIDGPRLEHGFIDTAVFEQMERKTTLHTSDLIHEIIDIGGVRVVKDIVVSTEKGKEKKWSLDLDPRRVPRLDIDQSEFSLERKQLKVGYNLKSYDDERLKSAAADQPPPLPPEERDYKPPAGQDRKVGNYYSLQHQFPAVYGIGELGLPASASRERKAQAKQLKAYLLFFDQLLANYFAQLAHVKELFDFQQEPLPHTYFATVIDDPRLKLENIRLKELDAHRDRLQQIAENPWASADAVGPQTDWRRKHRFLDHLLARFAEQFTDYSLLLYDSPPEGELTVEAKLEQDKRAFLQQYPEISSGRGTGFNYREPWSADRLPGLESLGAPASPPASPAPSGLEQRLRSKLGIADRFYLIEHILLRPVQGDKNQQAPLLADVRRQDPYSLQLSLVFPADKGFFQRDDFRRFVEQTVRAETPAHLMPYLYWLHEQEMAVFEAAYQDWLVRQRDYGMDKTTHVRLRDARDRLIDLLQIGQTYPLRDLDVTSPLMVIFNISAKIPIAHSQAGVTYQLCDETRNAIAGYSQESPGGDMRLETPPIQQDSRFTIQAIKFFTSQAASQPTGRSQFLLQVVEVKLGLDTRPKASILAAPLLEPIENAPGDAPRIVAYGASVEVEIQNSQEGVHYRLVCNPERDSDPSKDVELLSLEDQVGNLGRIVLRSRPVFEDTDISIRAIDPSGQLPQSTVLLKVVLPLKVRANPALAVSVEPVIDFNGTATLTLAATQATAQYRPYVRRILDSEFIHGDAPDTAVLRIPIQGKPDVQVKQPAPPAAIWETPPDYEAAGEFKPGNGGELALTIDGLTADSLIIVQAQKAHHGAGTITSSVQLQQPAVVLVRPDPARPLQLRARQENNVIYAPIQVLGGQPGVFYYFSKIPEGGDFEMMLLLLKEFCEACALGVRAYRPPVVYFHQRDATDPDQNKGVDQLQVEVDLAIASPGSSAELPTHPDLAETPPEPPILNVDRLHTDTKLFIKAVKAQTGLEVSFKPVTAGVLLVQPGST